jgi:tetratricopeptide (TPR) repeat protein
MDPLDEHVVRQSMRLFMLAGDRVGALSAYRQLEADLERELGVRPSDETTRLYEQCASVGAASAEGTHRRMARAGDAADEEGERLVGRQPEWQKLLSSWNNALSGNAQLVAITGVAGIGKTRLAEELLTWARRQGYRAERTRSYAAHGSLAYAPLAELLRAESLRAGLDELEDVWLTEIARLAPAVLDGRPHASAPQPMAESWQRHRFFDAIARGLLASKEPLLLLFDDLQWCDEETLEWLGFLLHREPEARLLVVATARTDEIDRDHGYVAMATSLSHSSQFQEVPLQPLDSDETAELAAQVLGSDVSGAQSQQFYADTQGNPLFVVETARAQDGEGASRTSSVYDANGTGPGVANLPVKVYAVIRGRLALLSPRAQDLAGLAAVAGRSFSYDVLHEASGQDHTTLTAGVEELLQRRIILHRREDVYDFSHDRIRDVVYAEISSVRRRLLHDQMAQTLMKRYSADLDSVSGELAEHYQQAGRKQEAIEYLLRAGEVSTRQFANHQALGYYERAQALLPDDAFEQRYDLLARRLDLYERTEGVVNHQAELDELDGLVVLLSDRQEEPQKVARRRADLSVRRALFAYQMGLASEAAERSQEALTLAREIGASDLEFSACSIAANTYWSTGQMKMVHNLLLDPLKRAEAEGRQDHMASLLGRLAATGMFSGLPADEIAGHIKRFLSIYETTGNLVGQADGHNKLGYLYVHGYEDRRYEALCEFARSIELSERSGSAFWLTTSTSNAGYVHVLLGDYAEARPYLDRALRVAQEVENPHRTCSAYIYLGFEERNRGDLKAALASQEAALEIGARIGLQLWGTWAHREVALIYRAQGDYAAAEAHAREAIEMARRFGDTRQEGYALTALGLVLEDEGCPSAADSFQQAVDCYVAMELHNRSLAPLAGLARMAAAAGDEAHARCTVERILDHLESHELDRTEEGYRIYTTCYRLLHDWRDERAARYLAAAQEHLRVRSGSLSHVWQLRLFWDMSDHREIRDTHATGLPRRGHSAPKADFAGKNETIPRT